MQTHNIRGGPGDLASGLSVEGPVGRGGREPPQHPSVIGQCPVPLGPCLWTVLSRRARNKGRQLHRQGRQRKRLICERQMGPAVHYSVVFLLLFFQYVKVGPLPLAFSLMLRLELCGELGRGRKKGGPSLRRAGKGAQRGMLSGPLAMHRSGLDALGMGWSAGCKLQGKEEGLSIRPSTEL